MKFKGNSGAITRKIKGPTKADAWFEMTLTPVYTVIVPGVETNSTVKDIDYVTHTEATILTEGQVTAHDFSPGMLAEALTISSLNPEVGTVDENGRVTRVSDGVVGVVMATRWIKRRYDVPVSLVPGSTQTVATAFTAGSLGKNISDTIDNRISGVTVENAATYKPIYSTQDHANGVYVRNTTCWAYGIDLTAISPYTNKVVGQEFYYPVTLISPRHVIGANHWFPAVGNTVRFVTSDNVVIERTVTGIQRIGTTDIAVGLLNEAVPETITFAKFLPTTWINQLPGITFGVPVFYTDQEEKALVTMWNYNVGTSVYITYVRPSSVGSYAHRDALWESIIGGDSGSPFFLIINGQLVLLSCVYFVGGCGPSVLAYHTEINAAMTTLGGGYQLTEVDLSGFTSFA